MIIKKFTGKNENEAVEAAKKELGEGIVIMNVRQVKRKGLFAFLRSKLTEITVALEDEPVHTRTMNPGSAEPMKKDSGPEGSAAQGLNSNPNSTGIANSNTDSISQASSNEIEKKLDSLQVLLESRLMTPDAKEEGASAPANEETVTPGGRKEEPETRDNDGDEQDKFIRLLYNTMLENEVAETFANQIIEEVDKSRKPNMPMDYLLANIYQKMILKFGRSDCITAAKEGPKLVFFLGPTGVGKTTTIAKLASDYAINRSKKIALFTMDTYRIAAVEQLRTYAQILEVPFRVIYTKEEANEALAAFADYDYIFMDTAGHSHKNEEILDDMKVLLDSVKESVETQVFLVLSATTKYRDLLKIADIYKALTDFQLIFTKLDETTTVGNLLNLKLYADTPIAYITCGQNVPDDIEPFDPQKTVKQLLSGKD